MEDINMCHELTKSMKKSSPGSAPTWRGVSELRFQRHMRERSAGQRPRCVRAYEKLKGRGVQVY